MRTITIYLLMLCLFTVAAQDKPNIIIAFDKSDTADYNAFTMYPKSCSFIFSWKKSYNGKKEWFYHKHGEFEKRKTNPDKLNVLSKENANLLTRKRAIEYIKNLGFVNKKQLLEIKNNFRNPNINWDSLYSKIYIYSTTDSILYEVKRQAHPNKGAKSIIYDMKRVKRDENRKRRMDSIQTNNEQAFKGDSLP